jgi:Fe-S cluster biosynthesis and repair protein YggX
VPVRGHDFPILSTYPFIPTFSTYLRNGFLEKVVLQIYKKAWAAYIMSDIIVILELSLNRQMLTQRSDIQASLTLA